MRACLAGLIGLIGVIALNGCEDTYGTAGYGYAAPGYGYYGPGYGPGYNGYYGGPGYVGPGVVIAVGDRPYYRYGTGYYVGRSYYTWHGGHWRTRNGHRVWVHGSYVRRV